MSNIYNYSGISGEEQNFLRDNAQDIIKAMEAGLETGRDYTDQLNNGPGLKVESLDAMIKNLSFSEKQMVFFRMLPRQRVYNTVHEYNQLVKYGDDVGIANLEGETPEFTDSQYRRKSAILKFLGLGGQVTHPSTLVKTADGINMYAREVQNKTIKLMERINVALTTFDSSKVDVEFDGIFRQHMLGLNEIAGGSTTTSPEVMLDNYFNDPVIVDARGSYLTDDLVEAASHAVVNDRYGMATEIMGSPVIFSEYVKGFHESKRVLVGNGVSGTEGANMGQSVNTITTQFGKIDVNNDIFFDQRKDIAYNRLATSSKAPAAPTAGATVIATATDTKTKFAGFNGNYFYLVTAKNRYGESSPLVVNTVAQAVLATESVDLQVVAGSGNYATEAYAVYRTEVNPAERTTAKYYPLFEVSVSELASGYDGAAATKIRDRNRFIPNTRSAIVYTNNNEIWDYLQLAPFMRMDFAITSPSRRFAVMNYATPVLYQPGKISRIINIGAFVAS